MVRVAGLHDQVDAGIARRRGPTGARRREAHRRAARARRASSIERQTRCSQRRAAPGAGRARHPHRRAATRSTPTSASALDERFRRQIFPVLTPLAVGLGRPFPYISNLSLSLAVLVRDPVRRRSTTFARVKVPKEMLPRFVPVGDGRDASCRSRSSSPRNLDALFPGMEIVDHGVFRVTRDADFDGLRRGRRPAAGGRGRAAPPALRRGRARRGRRRHERRAARASSTDALEVEDARRLRRSTACSTSPTCGRSSSCRASPSCATRRGRRSPSRACSGEDDEPADVFAAMRQGDILVHHPYDSFVDLGRALRRAGGRRPRRARDQADRVPHERRLAARARR